MPSIFGLYLARIHSALQRPLTPSETALAQAFYYERISVNYAVEYFR